MTPVTTVFFSELCEQSLEATGCTVNDGHAFFDTVLVDTTPLGITASEVVNAARDAGINIRRVGPHRVAVAFDETAEEADLVALLKAFGLPSTPERTCMEQWGGCFLVQACVLGTRLWRQRVVEGVSAGVFEHGCGWAGVSCRLSCGRGGWE